MAHPAEAGVAESRVPASFAHEAPERRAAEPPKAAPPEIDEALLAAAPAAKEGRTMRDTPYDAIDRWLRAPDTRLAVLAGAGISKPSPSNLPTAGELMSHMVRGITSPAAYPAASELLISERPNRRHPKDFIRFELLVDVLAEYAFDARLTFLDPLAACRSPNHHHGVLAGLIERRRPVLTTNFDSLIELACVERGFRPVVAADDADFRSVAADQQVLFKLHGSFEIDGRDTRESLRATLRSIVVAGNHEVMMEAAKLAAFERVVRSHDLLVIGYSGADDFDVLPAIRNVAAPGRRILWINHHLDEPRLYTADALSSAPTDGHGHVLAERVALLDRLVRSGARNPSDVLLADCDTSEVLRIVASIAGIAPLRPGAPYAVDLASSMERWFARRLPREEDRWYVGAHVLFQLDRYDEARDLLAAVRTRVGADHDRLVKVMQVQINDLLRHANYGEAKALHEESRPLAIAHADRGVQASYWHQAGYVAYNFGEPALFGHRWTEARQLFRQALDSYRKALRIQRKAGDLYGTSVTLHQMALAFSRVTAPDRFEAMERRQRFVLFSLPPPTLAGRLRQRGQRTVRSLKERLLPLREERSLRKAERCLREAMALAKKTGQWQRYLESEAQMAAVLHLRRHYRREVQVLKDVIPRAALLGNTYVIGTAYGQLSLAYRYLGDLERSTAALSFAMRTVGPLHATDFAGAASALEKAAGAAKIAALKARLDALTNKELENLALGR